MRLVRPPGNRPDCETKIGCPKGHWSDPAVMRPEDWQAWSHFQRCRLTGRWPEDAIVIERGVALVNLEEELRLERETQLALLAINAKATR